MKRYGSVIRVREAQKAKYKELHAAVWPEVLKTIAACNIRNYSIFLKEPENLMFGYFEYVGEDYAADMARMAADPVTQDWWAVCMPCQDPLETRKEGEWWADMEEVSIMTDPRITILEGVYTSVLHDVMRAMGRRNFTLPPRITPLQPETVLTGPAFTIEGRIDETADAHQTLLDWTGLLSRAKAGHVWISQPHNQTVAQMGELSAETLHRKGVLGAVMDGGLRDANFILRLGFRCWRTFHTPRDVVGLWRPTGVDVPIMIGDVLIRPGDWLHGDRDGMVAIPVEILDEVIERAVAAVQTENLVRKAILEGVDPQEAYLRHGKF